MKPRVSSFAHWVLLALGVGFCILAVVAETSNLREERRFRRYDTLDALIERKVATGRDLFALRAEMASSEGRIGSLNTRLSEVNESLAELDDFENTNQTIVVSTADNKVQVRRDGKVVFEAVCSTGKGNTLTADGRFSTPTGKFKVISKEQNPVWVPPDWHYVEEARKKGLKIVRLEAGDTLDATSGSAPEPPFTGGLWPSEPASSGKVLKVKGDTIVEVEDGVERELPPGSMIRAGNVLVIPPLGVKQRRFDKVLGSYRLNLGDGYALHGTLQTQQLGLSVSHGCVRLGDKEIEELYRMASVGDAVIIY